MYTKQHKCLCGNCLEVFQGRKGQKFCSDTCLWNFHNVKVKLFSREDRVCPTCKEVFKTRHLNQKYCSHNCSLGFRRKPYSKVCNFCGTNFETYYNKMLYCSDKCSDKAKSKRGTTNNRSFIKKVGCCEVCGFKLLVALEAHHYAKGERIVLCGNCHNIWHQTSKERYAPKEAVINLVKGVRQEYRWLPLQSALKPQ